MCRASSCPAGGGVNSYSSAFRPRFCIVSKAQHLVLWPRCPYQSRVDTVAIRNELFFVLPVHMAPAATATCLPTYQHLSLPRMGVLWERQAASSAQILIPGSWQLSQCQCWGQVPECSLQSLREAAEPQATAFRATDGEIEKWLPHSYCSPQEQEFAMQTLLQRTCSWKLPSIWSHKCNDEENCFKK